MVSLAVADWAGFSRAMAALPLACLARVRGESAMPVRMSGIGGVSAAEDTAGLRQKASVNAPQGGNSTLYGMDLGIPLQDRRILVADHSAFNRKTLCRFLTWIGITEVAQAEDGHGVLSQVAQFAPDLVLLDTDLVGLDGFETCRRLRGLPAGKDLPILMQSTSHSDQIRTRCFQSGATDVITKPINPGEFIARVRYHLERRAMVKELRGFRDRIERDLEIARSMQLELIPKPEAIELVAAKCGLSIEAHFQSCDEIGGDVWSLQDLGEGRLGLLVVDFSGHGIAAAINTFRFHTLVSRCTDAEMMDPGAMLSRLNQELCAILPLGQYCTGFYGVIDTGQGTLNYAAAAQPSPFLSLPGKGIDTIDTQGTFLGCFPDEYYETRTVSLGSGGFLFLYSDVLTETLGNDGTMLGVDGLKNWVRDAAATERPLVALLGSFMAGTNGVLHDDLTTVWIAWP